MQSIEVTTLSIYNFSSDVRKHKLSLLRPTNTLPVNHPVNSWGWAVKEPNPKWKYRICYERYLKQGWNLQLWIGRWMSYRNVKKKNLQQVFLSVFLEKSLINITYKHHEKQRGRVCKLAWMLSKKLCSKTMLISYTKKAQTNKVQIFMNV